MKTRVGMINFSLNMLDHHVALARGHYRDQGVDVELVAPPGHQADALLTSGEVALTSAPVVQSVLKNKTDYKYVLFTRNGVPHYIMGRPEIKSARDLKGKTVRAGGGGANYYLTLDWLRDNGLQPGVDVRVRRGAQVAPGFFGPKGLPEWAVVLLSGGEIVHGGVDEALMTQVLERRLLTQEAGYNTLVDLPRAYPGRLVHGLAAHVDTLKEQPEVVQGVVNAHIAAARTIQEDKAFCADLIAEKWGVARSVAEDAWEVLHSCFIADISPEWLAPQLDFFATIARQENSSLAVTPPPAGSLVDPSFFSAAQ